MPTRTRLPCMTDQVRKRWGTMTCQRCGVRWQQFMTEVTPGALKGKVTGATCVCGWPLKDWFPLGGRKYDFEKLSLGAK